MTSDFVQRQILRLLEQAGEALDRLDWAQVRARAEAVLDLDPDNADAPAILAAADRALARSSGPTPAPEESSASSVRSVSQAQPTSFANGRYTVTKFLGEGGKKKVYLARDSRLDRDVAFALIKTEGLDEASRVRVQREAEAMGRLGAHPHIVTVFDIGEEDGQPYLVLPVLAGGDVEGVIEKAPENKLTIERAVKIALDTCLGLEFAHSKGIVHRDLKPGNVWLTEDGRAMIGDFGLAVAVDKSRLTQAGMMVGTVNYMPPEQAMGGEVGPRSDLYSLGAMLYETVCGRPPFVGDESVAIIGQHLNTPPVAPSWHRPDCPQGLESLILRLLEKDPSKRPASATEVREALESVSTSATPRQETVVQELPVGENPLYRRTFVGREAELKQVQGAFDAALSGQGGLVMVVGEPGIGKTALCEQLATYVALRGGKALVGHCYEEGSLSLPYLAFVEAMRSYVLAREPEGLRSDLGTGAGDVARIVSEVRDRVQGVELRQAGDPEDDRWRLLQAVTSFLRNASTVQPLCIVLEDVHWADRGTLDLLLHVSRNLQSARLLVVGTYRDVEVDRSHALSGTLADLRRGANFQRVPLRGLTVDEVHRMYEAVRGQATPWAQAEAVFRATEGNPLFVQEVLRYLVEEGIVVREDGRYVAAGGVGAGIPEGLRDVVGKRLSRLSDKTNQALAIAAVMGRDFRLDVLQLVAGLPEDDLYGALADAVERAVIEEHSGIGAAVAYRFAHAFFRQTLYEETIAPRRIRLHQQVARALETVYGRRLEEHAAELAEHYSYSSSPDDLKKAIEYGELAAQRAASVFDYGEAERHLQQALKVQEVLDPDDKLKRCDLLMSLMEAMLPQENPAQRVEVAAEEAVSLAELLGDARRVAHVAVRNCEAIVRSANLWTMLDETVFATLGSWAAKAAQYATPHSTDAIYADAYFGLSEITLGRAASGHTYLRRAIDEASKVEGGGVFFAAAGPAISYLNAFRDQDLVRRVTAELLTRPRVGVRAVDLSLCLNTAGIKMLEQGERSVAEEAWRDATALAAQTGDSTAIVGTLAPQACLAYFDGQLETARDLLETMHTRAQEFGVQGISIGSSSIATPVLFAAVRGGLGIDIEPMLEGLGESRAGRAQRAVLLAAMGRFSEVPGILARFGDVGAPEDESSVSILCALLHAAVLSGDKAKVAELSPRFFNMAGELKSVSWLSIGRILGDGSALRGLADEARGFYVQAIDVCTRVSHRPELALTRLSLAELLLEHYPDEHDAAIDHLDFAIAELRDMKMQPALERALRHRGLLKA